MKKITILGSTGSIGRSTLDVIKGCEGIEVEALAAYRNTPLLRQQITTYHPKRVCVVDSKAAQTLRHDVSIPVLEGLEGLIELAVGEATDVVIALASLDALLPTVRALEANKRVELATKEVMVSAGELIMQIQKGQLIPVDSEHTAILQCRERVLSSECKKVILPATGGPFWNYSSEALRLVTVHQALQHPVWKMGEKISIDSSTMMNKTLEMIEARWLWDTQNIEVVIHPQGILHGMIELIDHQMIAVLSPPDMKYAIQYALYYPERVVTPLPSLDLTQCPLHFYPPDRNRFPSLALGYQALQEKSSFACVLNSANTLLVEQCLRGEIPWIHILEELQRIMEHHSSYTLKSVEEVIALDQQIAMERA